jgi:hypothetical protein
MNIILPLPVTRWWPIAWRWKRRPERPALPDADAATIDALRELGPRTLADIGAPDALQWRVQAHRDAERACRDALRLGGDAGGWSTW